MIDAFQQWSKRIHMKINHEKTKIMHDLLRNPIAKSVAATSNLLAYTQIPP